MKLLIIGKTEGKMEATAEIVHFDKGCRHTHEGMEVRIDFHIGGGKKMTQQKFDALIGKTIILDDDCCHTLSGLTPCFLPDDNDYEIA